MEDSVLQHQEQTRLVAPLLNPVVTDVWTPLLLAVAVAAAFLGLVRCTTLTPPRRRRHVDEPVVPGDADLYDVPVVASHPDSDSGGESNATDEEENATTSGNAATSGFGCEAWRHDGFEFAWDAPVVTTWEGLRLGFCADDGELERRCLPPLESPALEPVVRLWERQGCCLDDVKGRQVLAVQRRRRPTVKVVRFAAGTDRREGYVADSVEYFCVPIFRMYIPLTYSNED